MLSLFIAILILWHIWAYRRVCKAPFDQRTIPERAAILSKYEGKGVPGFDNYKRNVKGGDVVEWFDLKNAGEKLTSSTITSAISKGMY